MISSRLLLSFMLGLFSLALGCFALARNPNSRLNRSFAAYLFVVTVWTAAPGFIIEFISHHQTALLLYRLVQISLPLHAYFLIRFVQDFADVFDDPKSKRLRRIIFACVLIFAPFYPTAMVIRDFQLISNGNDIVFQREAGPLYLVNIGLFLALFIAAFSVAFQALVASSGAKRNQMKFLALSIGVGIVSLFFYFATFLLPGFPPLFFFTHLLMLFGYSYTMFKYQLFEFGFLLRRFAIYVGVYLVLLSLPVFLFFPFRGLLAMDAGGVWLKLTLFTIAYAVLFSLAPMLTTYLRHLSEQKRWAHLRQQLDFLRQSSESLADETGLSLDETANRIVAVIRELYWVRLKTPLRFVFATMRNQAEASATAVFPSAIIDDGILREFLGLLSNVSPRDLTAPFGEAMEQGALWEIPAVKKYVKNNGIEICCPCVHNGKLYGAILLGPKEQGIFWPEEIATLQVAASYVATAVRKSELIERTRELHNLDQLKHDLISNITHEFKLPLSNVDSAVSILSEEARKGSLNDGVLEEFLEVIRNNSSQLGLYIHDLLSVAKIERAQVALEMEDTSLKELLQEAVRFVEPEARRKDLTIKLLPVEPVMLSVDQEKIRQVINNLLSNAIKFTEKGMITVGAQPEGEKIRITVQDTGRGIAPEFIDSIFDKFFRIPDPKNKRTKGTGLGLAIAKGWVAAHQGKLWVESPGVGMGSKFVIELPLTGSENS